MVDDLETFIALVDPNPHIEANDLSDCELDALLNGCVRCCRSIVGPPLVPPESQPGDIIDRPRWAVKLSCELYPKATPDGFEMRALCEICQREIESDYLGQN
jgi:hypothetical protein